VNRPRLFGALAVLMLAGTYVAAQIDFLRRHSPGLPPARYWLPQVTQIWLPGLGAALLFGLLAFAFRSGREKKPELRQRQHAHKSRTARH
jgi:hypothetical protein